MKPKFYYCVRSILSQINPVRALFFKLCLNIIFPFAPTSIKLSVLFKFSVYNIVRIYHLTHAFYTSRSSGVYFNMSIYKRIRFPNL